MNEIVDCHYCDYACTNSPDDKRCDCYVEDNGYFDHHVTDSKEAETCSYFRFCSIFPKC